MFGCLDLDLALGVDSVAAPHVNQLPYVFCHAPLEDVVMHDAWHPGMREDVRVACQYAVARKRPMLLCATCTSSHSNSYSATMICSHTAIPRSYMRAWGQTPGGREQRRKWDRRRRECTGVMVVQERDCSPGPPPHQPRGLAVLVRQPPVLHVPHCLLHACTTCTRPGECGETETQLSGAVAAVRFWDGSSAGFSAPVLYS